MGQIIERVIRNHGFTESAEVIDDIKAFGFTYSTDAGITYSMDDVKCHQLNMNYLKKLDEKVENVIKQYARGMITDAER